MSDLGTPLGRLKAYAKDKARLHEIFNDRVPQKFPLHDDLAAVLAVVDAVKHEMSGNDMQRNPRILCAMLALESPQQ